MLIRFFRWGGFFLILTAAAAIWPGGRPGVNPALMEELGKSLFFDAGLSTPPGQSCASCHTPEAGMTGPDSDINKKSGIYEGAVRGRFGNRKPPTAAYAGDSPKLHQDEEGNFVGGMFWDGRADGTEIGDPLAEQALGPFLNPLEHNMPDKKSVILKVKAAPYAPLFEKVWGAGSLDAEKDVQGTYHRIGRSIAAFERSTEVNPYSSKFDDFQRKAVAAGLQVEKIDDLSMKKFAGLGLSEVELQGLTLFAEKGLCAECHILKAENGKPPVFTDFTYDNLGLPRNPDNPFYGMPKEFNPDGNAWVDKGLGGFLAGTKKFADLAEANKGKHKVPTLRNVALSPGPGFVKAFGHNGFFKSLEDVVHFYNTRDVPGAKWPAPEVSANLNTTEMGKLGLTAEEEKAIVAFMHTLSDRR